MITSAPDSLTPRRVSELVTANRTIGAPCYDADRDQGVEFTDPDKGLQWGADAVPALMGLFRVERDARDDRPDRWVGFARHWRGGTLRLDFELFSAGEGEEPIVVVTAITGRAGETTIDDEDFGEVVLPEQVPSEEWEERRNRYQSARRKDDSDGSASLEAYVSALPGWKREVDAQFDEIVEREVPDVRRAVKYHQPFYGVEDRGWFAPLSAFTKHVKLSFVCESYLEPRPPSGAGPTRQALDVEESDELDEEQVGSRVRQAAEDPWMGW